MENINSDQQSQNAQQIPVSDTPTTPSEPTPPVVQPMPPTQPPPVQPAAPLQPSTQQPSAPRNRKWIFWAVLILIVLLAGGGVKYYLYYQQKAAEKQTEEAKKKAEEAKPKSTTINDKQKIIPQNPPADWKTVTSANGKFILKVPQSDIVNDSAPMADIILISDKDLSAATYNIEARYDESKYSNFSSSDQFYKALIESENVSWAEGTMLIDNQKATVLYTGVINNDGEKKYQNSVPYYSIGITQTGGYYSFNLYISKDISLENTKLIFSQILGGIKLQNEK
jgi:hypothetical protein